MYEGSFFASLWGTLKTVMFRPAEFFVGMNEDRPVYPSMIWALLILAINQVLQVLIGSIFQEKMMQDLAPFMDELAQELNMDLSMLTQQTSDMMLGLGLAFIPLTVPLVFFFFVLVYFISAQAWDAFQPSFPMFMRVCAFSMTPHLFGFGINILTMVAWIYTMILMAVAFIHAGKASTGRAIGAAISPLVLCCLCAVFCTCAGFMMFVTMAGTAG